VLPGVLENPAPLNAALEDPVLLAAPIATTSPESALSYGSLDLYFGVLPCNSLELTAVNNDAEHVVTSVAIPLLLSPPPPHHHLNSLPSISFAMRTLMIFCRMGVLATFLRTASTP
jgi:hypothetical protein